MRAVSFGPRGAERPGILFDDQVVDLLSCLPGAESPAGRGWRGILEREAVDQAHRAAKDAFRRGESTPVATVRLGAPIPDPSKIIAIGLNYRDHALEQKKEPPLVPLLFAKAPSCLAGPRDPIRLPVQEPQVDAEAELCLVISRRASRVSEVEALQYIFGWTVMNDVSGRAAQYGDKQWFRGKSFDSFGPCGPAIVTRDELPDPIGLSLEADWGEVAMQRGNTRDLIHGPAALVSYISHQMTLEPGDLITTGTPAGVGVFRDPPVFLQPGMTVTIRLESIGELSNRVE